MSQASAHLRASCAVAAVAPPVSSACSNAFAAPAASPDRTRRSPTRCHRSVVSSGSWAWRVRISSYSRCVSGLGSVPSSLSRSRVRCSYWRRASPRRQDRVVQLLARTGGPILTALVRQQTLAIAIEGQPVLLQLTTAAGGRERRPVPFHVEPQTVRCQREEIGVRRDEPGAVGR